MQSFSSSARSTQGPGALRRVPTRLVLVAGVHLALIYALMTGLGVHAFRVEPPSTTIRMLDPVVPPPEKFVPPDPSVTDAPVLTTEVPPLGEFEIPELPQPPARDPLPSGVDPGPRGGTSTPEPVVSAAAVDPHHPLTQPPYPLASIRNNEAGALSLAILIGIDGRVHDARVVQSSGSQKLDQAAVNEAKAHWHLLPATRNGVPFEEWLTLRVVFRLDGR